MGKRLELFVLSHTVCDHSNYSDATDILRVRPKTLLLTMSFFTHFVHGEGLKCSASHSPLSPTKAMTFHPTDTDCSQPPLFFNAKIDSILCTD